MRNENMGDTASLELQPQQGQQPDSGIDGDYPSTAPLQELKPVDRGRDAWVVLLAGFVFEALFWGSFFVRVL